LTSEESVGRAIAAAEANHGFARVLVNCATTAMSLPLVAADGTTHPLAELRRSLEDNLVATFNVLSRFVTRLVHADLIGEERGVIVNTASIAASDGQIGQSAYAAAKAGVVGMTLPLARELAEHKIRVMTISPGMFATPGFMTLPSEIRAGLERRVPHPSRAGNVDEFARLVVEIVENPMLNGAVIRLDGAIRLAPT
jgi:NAD(P)-dependent dehydrogenase (short-subunit alcohol dehydrogenase family)